MNIRLDAAHIRTKQELIFGIDMTEVLRLHFMNRILQQGAVK